MKPRILTLLLALALSSTPLQAAEGDTASTPAAPATPAAAESAPRDRVLPNPSAAIQADLARALDATTELLWLETGEQKTLALSAPHNTREQSGTVIILHDQHTSADWPELVSTLRKGLPDKGWATLSLQLPDAPWLELPPRSTGEVSTPSKGTENTADNADAAATPTASATYSKRMAEITSTAFDRVQSNEGELVILGVGTGAIWATAFVRAQEQSSKNLSLVLLDSRQPEHPQAPDLMTLLPELSSTVLDMYHGSTLQENAAANPRNRNNLAQRNELDNYHQSRLPLLPGDRKKRNQWVLSRVRGFMQTHILAAAEQKKSKKGKRRRVAGPTEEFGPGGSPVNDGSTEDSGVGMMEESI